MHLNSRLDHALILISIILKLCHDLLWLRWFKVISMIIYYSFCTLPFDKVEQGRGHYYKDTGVCCCSEFVYTVCSIYYGA